MSKRRYAALILILLSTTATGFYYVQHSKPSEEVYTGFWTPQSALSPNQWVNLTKKMASLVQGSSQGNIWGVGRVETSAGTCVLTFPSNQTYPHMFFYDHDGNEDCFTAFDKNGVKVWLQVEPGFADINQLIDVVLKRYGNHRCVRGFAIDLEWHWDWPNKSLFSVTDEEAGQWLDKIKNYNAGYKLLLIHWLPEVMPPAAREDIVFIDDQQHFEGLSWLMDAFKLWGEYFSQSDVGYIYGFDRDLDWFSTLENPPGEIGSALIQNISNCGYLFWADETILEVFSR